MQNEYIVIISINTQKNEFPMQYNFARGNIDILPYAVWMYSLQYNALAVCFSGLFQVQTD